MLEPDDGYVDEVLGGGIGGRCQERFRALGIDVRRRADEITRPEATPARRGRVGRRVDYRFHAGDRLDQALARGEIAARPLNRAVLSRPASKHAHLMTFRVEPGDERAAEVAGSSSYKDLHWLLMYG